MTGHGVCLLRQSGGRHDRLFALPGAALQQRAVFASAWRAQEPRASSDANLGLGGVVEGIGVGAAGAVVADRGDGLQDAAAGGEDMDACLEGELDGLPRGL
jgi:hypothetical protein